MNKSQASWSADGSDIPEVDPHTKAKHQIIEVYITNLVITLAKGTQQQGTLTLIDGFCGGGIYNDLDSKTKWYGSPIRLINAVMEGLKFVRDKMSKPNYALDYQFIFIDNKQDHLSCLKNYALPQAGWEELAASEKCVFMPGEFENLSTLCLFKLYQRKGHSFWLLDPFGWTHVSIVKTKRFIYT